MKPTRTIFYYALLALVVVAGFATVHAVYAQQQPTSYAIVGAKVFPISGPAIDGATVVIRDGKIASVGKGGAPAGAKVIDGKGLEVYPGLFNAVTEIGLNEIGEGDPGSVDTQELGEYNPQLMAATGVNPASAHIPVTRADGITHVISAEWNGRQRRRRHGDCRTSRALQPFRLDDGRNEDSAFGGDGHQLAHFAG